MSPTFGIAFGGGGARGLAHIHVIEALDELGIRPVAIAGSSIGAIMGAGMAAGLSGKDIREIPHTLRDATVAMTESTMLRAAFGDAVIDHYTRAAQWEQEEYDRRITDWEVARGFERA